MASSSRSAAAERGADCLLRDDADSLAAFFAVLQSGYICFQGRFRAAKHFKGQTWIFALGLLRSAGDSKLFDDTQLDDFIGSVSFNLGKLLYFHAKRGSYGWGVLHPSRIVGPQPSKRYVAHSISPCLIGKNVHQFPIRSTCDRCENVHVNFKSESVDVLNNTIENKIVIVDGVLTQL